MWRMHCPTQEQSVLVQRAGFAPEIEKAEPLLPQRPEDTRVALRRPADVYLPALEGSPTALDLAITGPLRSETLAEAGRHALAAASAYAQLKATRTRVLNRV